MKKKIELNNILKEHRCRCLASDSRCWPNVAAWQALNDSVDGRLIVPQPSAAPCTKSQFNLQECIETSYLWNSGMWRSYKAGAIQYHNWENSSCSIYNSNSTCKQGSIPVFAINATLPEHVQTTVRFAAENNLRLVIKTTGHDMMGRSTAYGALLLWVHYMKNMTYIEKYLTCKNVEVSNVVRLDAGVQWGDVYKWLNEYNVTIIGSNCYSVGATGGYLQGGGHSALSRWKGLAIDQVLEYDVVTADGQRLTVNACENSDLFWALNGGGGGTYAIVLSVLVYRPCKHQMRLVMQS